jgi:dienelactone hydrolase
MDFTDPPVVSHGVVERRFDVAGPREVIPGIVWTPEGATGERPLVLVGHGGSGSKRLPYVVSLARRLVRHAGYAVAAIDAVGHGERASAPLAVDADGHGDGDGGIAGRFVSAVAAAADDMIEDWTTALRELRALDEVGNGPLGYWGVSMGTMFGLPFVAATPEVRCAVFGLMGSFDAPTPWAEAAPSVTCPVLFLVQTDDELVPPGRALALFRSIGSEDKRLHAHPGAHSAVPVEEVEASEAFFATHLAG